MQYLQSEVRGPGEAPQRSFPGVQALARPVPDPTFHPNPELQFRRGLPPRQARRTYPRLMRRGLMMKATSSRTRLVICGAVLLAGVLGGPAAAQLQVSSADGTMSAKLGLLSQVQGESIDDATATHSANNLFFRRLRLIGGFKLSDKLSFFIESDVPNLGKGNPDGTKNNADLFIQDATATYAFSKGFQIDAGLMLPPSTYNHTQSAATLLAVDFGPYSFNESTPLTARTGRDYGAEARGYLAGDHLEYRAGVFQGARGAGSVNPFRLAGRLTFWAWGAQTGFFYRGTSLGKTPSLGIGGSYDAEKDYKAYSGDLFWEQPVAGGDGITVQVDYQTLDGDIFLTSLPKQKNTLAEVGYYIHGPKLQPYIQYARNDFDDPRRADEKRTQAGLAFFFGGHNQNVKLAYTDIDKQGAVKRKQYLLQYQVFQF
jgi:Phosphate-selective porin O and P